MHKNQLFCMNKIGSDAKRINASTHLLNSLNKMYIMNKKKFSWTKELMIICTSVN